MEYLNILEPQPFELLPQTKYHPSKTYLLHVKHVHDNPISKYVNI
jgi:hypothetical protein